MRLRPVMQFLLLAICSTQLTLAQDCGMAPTPVFAVICEQLQRWDVATRRLLRLGPSAGPQTMPPGIPFEMQGLWQPEFNNNQVQQPVPRSPYSCMDLSCLCQFLNGQISPDGACFLNSGQRLTQVVRKEYRRLTDDERSRFHDALNQLKQNGEYHNFARIHTQMSDSGGAHSGPAFLPWHREFTKRLEIALRMIDPEVALPYWDSVLDRNLPDARDSVLWTSEFFGESDSAGNVINGPYANWRTLEGRSTIQRHLARQGSLLTEDQLNTFYQKSNIASVLAHTTPAPNCPFRLDFTALEYVHGNVHFWVGGDMLEQSTSANDPTFYLHHSFVDLIWEQWRQQRQSRWERENDFPEDIAVCSNEQHFRDSEMRPFDGIRNFHGLSNTYTDELYTFEPRPSCANDEQDCRSDYLFCDRSHGRPKCVSKVKLGGRCDGFERENICYDGICRNGRCVESRSSVTATPAKSKTTRRPAPRRKKPAAAFNNCFNEHPCCASWAAKGECSKNPRFMNKQCQPSCNKCRPSFDVSKECSDHHKSCQFWRRRGECKKSAHWMEENCRKSCGLCKKRKSEQCSEHHRKKPSTQRSEAVQAKASRRAKSDSRRHHPTKAHLSNSHHTQRTSSVSARKQAASCTVTECFNEDKCCDEWKRQGRCTTDVEWMNCNCKVSCKVCQPTYDFGSCTDYHGSCPAWGQTGECKTNPWMMENCRTSCQACRKFTKRVLRKQCHIG